MTRDRESLNVGAAAYLAREHDAAPDLERPLPDEYRADDMSAPRRMGVCFTCGAQRVGPNASCFYAGDSAPPPTWCDRAERLAAA